jgi:hypothetical protein
MDDWLAPCASSIEPFGREVRYVCAVGRGAVVDCARSSLHTAIHKVAQWRCRHRSPIATTHRRWVLYCVVNNMLLLLLLLLLLPTRLASLRGDMVLNSDIEYASIAKDPAQSVEQALTILCFSFISWDTYRLLC